MAVSIDAQAAINQIARDLERGVDGYRASAAPDPVIGFSSPSTQFGDQEFLHEIGMYGTSDPLLRAALREFGASIAKTIPQSEMAKISAQGESITKHSNYPFSTTPYTAISKTEFDLPTIWPFESKRPVKDREYLNDLWRHEYRHQGMDILREKSDRGLYNKAVDFLSRTYTAPIDYELQTIFSGPQLSYLPRTFGMLKSRKHSNTEALMRVMDTLYGKSATLPGQSEMFLSGLAGHKGLINEPATWADKFDLSDPNSILNKIQAILEANQ